MLGKITITKEKFLEEDLCIVNIDGIYDYECTIYNENKEELSKILSKEVQKKAIEQELATATMYPETLEEELEMAKYLLDNKTDIIESAEYVEIDYELPQIKEYIEKNSILKSKKVILPKIYNLNYKTILEIEKIFPGCPSYIYLKTPGNRMPISIDTFKKTLKKIEEIVINIKKLDLSPIEQVMFAYDVVKDKEYQEESEDESAYLSRDVSTSLFGDKIVCVGYSNIFKTILDKLGIKNDVYFVTNHQRNIAYIKDEKYDIEGIYYFDATGDSKIATKGNKHFNRYLYFAKTKHQMDRYYKTNDETLPSFYDLLSSDVYFDFIESEGLVGTSRNLILTINKMSKFIEDKILIPFLPLTKKDVKCTNENVRDTVINNIFMPQDVKINKEEIDEKLADYLELFDKKISASTMLKILYNVRKKQWYINPEKYPFSENDFIEAVINSKWSFQGDLDNMDIIELLKQARRKITIGERVEEAQDHIENENIDRDIEKVKTAKVLRRVLESKKQN